MPDLVLKEFPYDKKLEDGSVVERKIEKAVCAGRPSAKQIASLATEWHCSATELTFKKSEYTGGFEVLKPRGTTVKVIPADDDE